MTPEVPDFASVYAVVHGQTPPARITGSSDADILRPARGFVDAFDLTMQTQVGCPGGCLFCYVPSGNMLTPGALRGNHGEAWGFEVRPKRDVLAKLARHLERGTLADKVIYWSGVTDPYAVPALETRAIWTLLNDSPPALRPRRIIVQTRYRPDRDAGAIAAYNASTPTTDGGPPVVVSYSVGTDREDLIRAWEHATPPFAQRLRGITALRRAGVWVVPTLSPFGLWHNLPGTLQRFKALEIPYITVLFFKKNTDSANTPARFTTYLQREYPLLLDKNWQAQRLAELRAIYGQERVLIYKQAFASLAAPHDVAPHDSASEQVASDSETN